MRGQIYIPILLIIILLGISLAGGFVGLPKPKYFAYANNPDMAFYIENWKFQEPTKIQPLDPDIITRLRRMVPYAIKGAGAYDNRYNQIVTPQLIVWWSYVEGTYGAISYSNCHDKLGYSEEFHIIQNCDYPTSWQLGYGIQFDAVPNLLKNAYLDLHRYDSPHIVGQTVLKIDSDNNTTPQCGGYSCDYPNNLDEIINGISTSHQTDQNWWASVMARDPAINAYINAAALTPAGLPWGTGWMSSSYYAKEKLSNMLAQILQAWPQLIE